MKRARTALFLSLLVTATSICARAQAVMRGDVDYRTYGSRVEVNDIANLSDAPAERLRLNPWDDFARGRIPGLAATK